MKTSHGKSGALFLAAILAGFANAQLTRVANTTLNLPAALPSTTGYNTVNAFGTLTFASPMVVTSIAGETSRLFVAQRGGLLRVVTNLSATTPTAGNYLNLTSILGTGETLSNASNTENGFLSVAFHPDFANNRTLYVYYTIVRSGAQYQRLHRIILDSSSSNTPTIASHTPLLTILDRAGNHNGGSVDFGADGCLYLSLGDEGNGGDSFDNARYITQRYDPPNNVFRTGFWGQMLRLDVDNRTTSDPPNEHQQNSTAFPSAVHAGTYSIPHDNPFIGRQSWHGETIDPDDIRTEIWATGLRNPFRWSFDKPTGRLFLGDVGQGAYEEIDIIISGGDYGWSWREGRHDYNPPPPANEPAGFAPIDPIFEYDRTNNGNGSDAVLNGYCVTGGAVYRGNALTELFGAYIFADLGGALVALRENGGVWTGQRLGDDDNLVHFGHNPLNGDLLMCDLGTGEVKKLVRVATTPPPDPLPATLSAAGVFSSPADLTPNAGIVPYDVNVPFWSDHAIKRRWFSIKNTTDDVVYQRDANWTLPTGMVWVKHFDIETTRGNPATARKLETRILVKTIDGTYGLSYRWRDDQTDAELVPEEGLDDPLTITVGTTPTMQTWRFPSRSECQRCHTSVGGHALSFNTRQLNHDHFYGSQTLNQIAALEGAGYFTAAVSGVNTLPAYAPAADSTQSLEWRVRSYFAVNCSQCHQPGGPASGNWDARSTVEMDSAALINGPLLNNYGDTANRFVVPGDATHSIALKRLNGIPSRMPPVGSNVVDQGAIDLITAWLTNDLPTRQSFSQWQVAKFGDPVPAQAGPTEDPDGDGINNRTEFLAGTPPLAPATAPLLRIQRNGGQLQFDYNLPANRSMVIETSPSLAAGSWVPWNVAGNTPRFPATGGPKTFAAPQPGAALQFFRARISTP